MPSLCDLAETDDGDAEISHGSSRSGLSSMMALLPAGVPSAGHQPCSDHVESSDDDRAA
jgi:hypothetical protein